MADPKAFSKKDSIEINELVALDGDISDDFLDKLQQQVMEQVSGSPSPENESDDSTLFEEVVPQEEKKEGSELVAEAPAVVEENIPQPIEQTSEVQEKESQEQTQQKSKSAVGPTFDDNFIKKYKARLNKQSGGTNSPAEEADTKDTAKEDKEEESINKISNGNITEHLITNEQKSYNDSLDFLDNNIKYSKYVIYIDPKNVDFIESLTVKERKNLINNILKQQNDISVTKQRFRIIQNVIMHLIISILTIAISMPIIYFVINASIEASIDNYKRSQSNFQTLYREKGKISNTK